MRIKTLLLGTVFAALLVPAAALAQTAPDATAGETATNVDEVIVTARKREERLQDVPISVTAVTAETIEREQITTVRDIAAFAPGLTINSDAVGRAFVSIRGIGTTLIDSVQPGVGIFIDGIYQPNTSYLNSPINDVERIEVLRGPQGTLFGNNTLGGAISVVTRQPTDEFAGRFSLAVADPDNYVTTAFSFSGPIIPGAVRGRLAASFHQQDGFQYNSLVGGDPNPLDDQSVNGTLVWLASDNATISLNAYYNRVRGGQTNYTSPASPTDYTDAVPLNVNSIATYRYWGMNLKGVFDLESLNTQVTAIAAYDDKHGTAKGDGDFGPIDYVRVLNGDNRLQTTTGELRFDTRWSENVTSLVGFFANESEVANSYDSFFVPFGFTANSATTGKLAAQAVFGTVFWQISDTLELAAGLRYDHQTVEASNAVRDYSASELEPRVTLTQHWSRDWMTYASIARGFRGGGANGPGAPNPIYAGDSVWTYEIGNKFMTADRSLMLNVSLYYNDYSDYIGQNSLAPCTSGCAFTAINLNSGDVTSYGAEIEVVWKPTEQFTLQGGFTYNHSRVTDGSPYFNTTGIPLATDRILFLPDWNFSTTASYLIPVGADDIRLDATLIGKGDRVGSTLDANFAPELESYYLVNASVSWTHDDLSVGLFATNLFDERFYESYLDSSLLSVAGFTGPLVHNLGILGDGRRVGVRLKYNF